MKNRATIIGALLLAGALTFALAGCGEQGKNPYEVATDLGYSGSAGEWLAEGSGQSTEARRLYEEAKADGYEGSFVDFLKEIGYQGDDTAAINRAIMATVDVIAGFERAGATLFDTDRSYGSGGAGVIYSLDRAAGNAYIVTNYHVVYSADSTGREKISHISDSINVYLYGNEYAEGAISATYVGGAAEYDVAVLRVENSAILKQSSAMAVKAGDSDAISVGERVYTIGNANSGGLTVCAGVVSVDAEYIDIEIIEGKGTVSLLEIRTDATINHGNSGGGLFNSAGELVGIVNARAEASGIEHFGYALPSNITLSVAQNIIDNSKSNNSHGAFRATLGLTVGVSSSTAVYDEGTCRAYIMETITVQEVSLGSAAFGKVKAGDTLYSVSINGGKEKRITRLHMLGEVLFNVRKGDTLTLVLGRGNGTETVELTFSNDKNFTLFS